MSDNDNEPDTQKLPIIPENGIVYNQEEDIDDVTANDDINKKIPDPASFKYLGSPKRKVIKHDGKKYLVIARSEITERGMFGRKTSWNNKVSDLHLLKNGLVDHLHAKRVPFIPLDDENEIRCLMRHNWWSHGPKQLVVLFFWLVGLVVIFLANFSIDESWRAITIVVSTVWTCFWATRYYPIWMKWAHDWIIVTDKRLILTYNPPFKLPGNHKTVMLASIITVDTEDPNWFQNIIGCGSLQVRTADNDQDLDHLLVYVNHHKQIRELLISGL